jgi:hypothetical protein
MVHILLIMINIWLLYGYMVTIWLTMVNNLVVVEPTPLKNMMEFVSWDDDIPNVMGTNKIYVRNHQPQFIYDIYTLSTPPLPYYSTNTWILYVLLYPDF